MNPPNAIIPALTFVATLFSACATNSAHLYSGKQRLISELASIKTGGDVTIDGKQHRHAPPIVYVLPGQHTLGIQCFTAAAGHEYEARTVTYVNGPDGSPLKFKSGEPADPVLRGRLRMAASSLNVAGTQQYAGFIVDRTAQKVVTPVWPRARAESEFTAHELGIPLSGLR